MLIWWNWSENIEIIHWLLLRRRKTREKDDDDKLFWCTNLHVKWRANNDNVRKEKLKIESQERLSLSSKSSLEGNFLTFLQIVTKKLCENALLSSVPKINFSVNIDLGGVWNFCSFCIWFQLGYVQKEDRRTKFI